MSNVNKIIEDLFSAASFAEEGEPQFARQIMAAGHCLPRKKALSKHGKKILSSYNR